MYRYTCDEWGCHLLQQIPYFQEEAPKIIEFLKDQALSGVSWTPLPSAPPLSISLYFSRSSLRCSLIGSHFFPPGTKGGRFFRKNSAGLSHAAGSHGSSRQYSHRVRADAAP
uniref:Uncharacterized protein n=1 Tax=Corethron hystrix TaxID=216773 RepID=A0A7S1FXF1_9STRA